MNRASYNRPKPFGQQAMKAKPSNTETYYRITNPQTSQSFKTKDLSIAKSYKELGLTVHTVTVNPF